MVKIFFDMFEKKIFTAKTEKRKDKKFLPPCFGEGARGRGTVSAVIKGISDISMHFLNPGIRIYLHLQTPRYQYEIFPHI
jgi:hypothetical protein